MAPLPSYCVRHLGEGALAEAMGALEPQWDVYVIEHPMVAGPPALVATRLMREEYEDETAAVFTAMRVYGRAGGQALSGLMERRRVYHLELEPALLQQLRAGELGTYALVGDEEARGLLADAVPVDARGVHRLAERATPADAGNTTPAEDALIRAYRELTQPKRVALLVLLDAQVGPEAAADY